MPDFDVGNLKLQDLLEWVDQPPPQQGRDTHALKVFLDEFPEERLAYSGLLFFRPGNPRSPIFQQQPGLSGILRPLLTLHACSLVLPQTPGPVLDETLFDHFFVRVEIRFRPPRVFAVLFFLKGGFRGFPGETLREVEFSQVDVRDNPAVGGLHILMDPLDGWALHNLEKTTVLYRQP
jgi:hypothetical protein